MVLAGGGKAAGDYQNSSDKFSQSFIENSFNQNNKAFELPLINKKLNMTKRAPSLNE